MIPYLKIDLESRKQLVHRKSFYRLACLACLVFLFGTKAFADVQPKHEKASVSPAASLDIDHVNLRIDRYPLDDEQWVWTEGWGHWQQYFPDHFKLGATVHIFVRNTGSEAILIQKIHLDGVPVESLTTSPQKVGPVIWHRVNPEVIEPGAMGMVYVRLREVPKASITLTLTTAVGQKLSTVVSAANRERIRLGHVGFNHAMDVAYVYVESDSEKPFTVQKVYLDGMDLTHKSEVLESPSHHGLPTLIEISLDEPLAFGSYHCLKVTTEQGASAMHQIRVRDDQFRMGIISGQTPIEEYHAKFFNLLYAMHGHHKAWDADSKYAKLGFSLVRQAPTAEKVKAMVDAPSGRIMYTNIDEADAKDYSYRNLPVFDRLGTSVMAKVEPVMKMQRKLDSHHETTFIIDRTYSPRNWLDYGEVADVLIQDTYLPTPYHGYDMAVYPNTLEPLLAAVSPRPAHMMFWGTMNTGTLPRRAPTPQENDLMVHYAVGSGIKGIHYFLDWNSFPIVFEGGYYIGSPRIKMLWKQMGRVNAKLSRIQSLLSIGHRYDAVSVDNDKLWARSLLCGKDNILVVLVNRRHHIHANTATKGAIPHIYPVNATVSVQLPQWFSHAKAYEVNWDGIRSLEMGKNAKQPFFSIEGLQTARVILLSRDKQILSKLKLDPQQFAALIESEKPDLDTNTPSLSNVMRPDASITLTDVQSGQLELDVTRAEVLAQASRIHSNGSLRLGLGGIKGPTRKISEGRWLGFSPPLSGGGEAELVFKFQSPDPLTQVTATLISQTPNFTYRAHNVLGISVNNQKYIEDNSLRVKWNGGAFGGEKLQASIKAQKGQLIKEFYVRVQMRDPSIVTSDQATNILQSLRLNWETKKN